MNKKKVCAIFIAFLFVITLFPAVSLAAPHDIEDGDVVDLSDAAYTAGDTLNIAANASVTVSGTKTVNIICGEGVTLTLSGAAIDVSATSGSCPISFTGSGNTLNLTDSTTSTLTAGVNAPAVHVPAGTTLTIGGSGTLNATGGQNGAGIGSGLNQDGGVINISGSAHVTARGSFGGAGIGGGAFGHIQEINISGSAQVDARGDSGAAIGGGGGCDGGTINIGESAVVTAVGNMGASIGGGGSGDGGTINISGTASVTATSSFGAGIGSGEYGNGGTITISGAASVTATCTDYGAGIGNGQYGNGGTVTITGGTVVAQGGFGYDIGGGYGGTSGGTLRMDGAAYLTLDSQGTNAAVTIGDACIRDDSTSSPITDGFYIDGTHFTGTAINMADGSITGSGASYADPVVTITDPSQDYLIAGNTTANGVVVSAGTASATDIILFDTSITPGSGCAFDITGSSVNLELAGSSTLQSSSSVCAGLQCPDGAAVTISSSPVLSDGSDGAVGSLTAKGGYTGAGIGGGSGENGGTIRIEGGTVNALGNEAAAAIGGGNDGNGGDITISGGEVTASGSWRGAGIGGGRNGDGGQIAITGGCITARSEGPQNDSGGGAGIGGGQGGDGGQILISGGVVNAYGAVREYGCGIGGGMSGEGGTITISGGTVTAVGNKSGAGIGGSVGHTAGTIRITGGTVNATGGSYGAGIGGDGGTVAIEGGTVTAQSRWSGAGIGGNMETCVDTITISGGVVNATGGDIASGIGAGAGIGTGGGYTLRGPFDGGSITISGGTVTATGGSDDSAGIGGGWKGGAGTIAVSGGTVYAAGNGGQDIGPGQDGAGGTLSISDTAAVFLGTDSCIAPATTTHTHQTFTEDTNSAYGLDIPSAWTPTFGAYLRLATLSFNANGGSGSVPGSVTQLYNTTANTANGSGLSRAYYTFDGWNTAANGSGTNYAAGSTFTFASNTTLYAKWAANTYTVAYNANGGSGTTASSSHTYNASKALTANGFTKTGCIFAGWATSAGGMVVYTDKQSVNNLTSTDGTTVTLYAQWTKLKLSSSVSDGKIYTGGRIVLTPSVDGGEWDWDEGFFSATFNSPATFTALKAGTTTVSYSLDGVSVSYDVTIEESELPSTGQDVTLVYLLLGMGMLTLAVGVIFGLRMKGKTAH